MVNLSVELQAHGGKHLHGSSRCMAETHTVGITSEPRRAIRIWLLRFGEKVTRTATGYKACESPYSHLRHVGFVVEAQVCSVNSKATSIPSSYLNTQPLLLPSRILTYTVPLAFRGSPTGLKTLQGSLQKLSP